MRRRLIGPVDRECLHRDEPDALVIVGEPDAGVLLGSAGGLWGFQNPVRGDQWFQAAAS